MASNNIKKEMRLEFERCNRCGQKISVPPLTEYKDTPEGDKVRAALTGAIKARRERKQQKLK